MTRPRVQPGLLRAMRHGVIAAAALVLTLVCSTDVLRAQSRFLTREDILVYGLGLRVEPAQQTVPVNIATIVSTFLATPSSPSGLPPFAPDAMVHATLRGPSFQGPVELTSKPNTPLAIPPLAVPGPHTVENIRLVSGGEVVLYGTPEAVRIDVIERLLVTQITARPLTAEEIRAKGIVYNKDNFQAYNFTAAFALEDGTPIQINFPVVLPTIASPDDVSVPSVDLSLLEGVSLKTLTTLIPDTLRIQTQVPNLSVVGFTLVPSGAESQPFFVPPIPGVIVIPGDIGFLNQFFSVMLLVSNVAPSNSNLVVTELSASVALPPGTDNVVGSGDDPLRLATLATGSASPGVQIVRQAGLDGRLGTSDDVDPLAPGETGSAEFVVEGRREGTHVIEMELAGTLNGLPGGPVPIRGRAAGAVLVRNPSFTLTFTHPDVVNAGEPYSLDVTVTNTSESPANFVSLNLNGRNLSGARLSGEGTRTFDSIAPGDSAITTFDLVALRTGRVTAATLASDGNVAGRFELKTGIGEFGVPLSPDSLVLPKEASSLPKELRDAVLGLLGRAWAIATAPAAAVPPDLQRFSKQIVFDRAVSVAEAGFRYSLGEPLAAAVANLLMDFDGSDYPRIAERTTKPEDVPLVQQDYTGFDLLRRKSFRGNTFAEAVGRILAAELIQGDAAALHRSLADTWSYRPDHVSVLFTGSGGTEVPVDIVLVDSTGRVVGPSGGGIAREIPFSDYVPIADANGIRLGTLALVAVPEPGVFTVRVSRRDGVQADARYDVSVVVPGTDGALRQSVVANVGPDDLPDVPGDSADPYRVEFVLVGAQPSNTAPAAVTPVPDPPPSVLGVKQMAFADLVGCTDGPSYQAGRVIAVLFSEEVTAASVQDQLRSSEISSFLLPGNRVLAVALQPGRRVALLALRDPVGPFVPRAITIEGVKDRKGQSITATTVGIESTVTDPAGVVSGQVIGADGTPAAGADVRLYYEFQCAGALSGGGGTEIVTIGISSKTVDANGRFSWDYVLKGPHAVKIVAVDTETGEIRTVRFNVARDGQRLNVNVALLGRGVYRGRTLAEDGRTPLVGTVLRVTSLTDQSQYGATTDASGSFEIPGVPVGTLLVEAVNVARPAQVFVNDIIPFAGAATTRDLILIDRLAPNAIVVQTGNVTGRVLKADGVTPVSDVPVIAYYATRSQANVACSPPPGGTGEPQECAVAVTRTTADGRFVFNGLTSGRYRIYTVDQAALAEGVARVEVPVNGTFNLNLIIAGGLGTVRGVVLDQSGQPVTDAVVGGGLSLVNVDATGHFVLTDVPIGRRMIVAASQTLGATASSTVDVLHQGDDVSTTIVFPPVGAVAGVVRTSGGFPVQGIDVYVLQKCFDDMGRELICIKGQARTDENGAYRVGQLAVGEYIVSAFRRDLSDGNAAKFAVRFHNQVLGVDISFRGGGGRVTGTVFAADGVTPLKARVAISGEQLVRAGDSIGVEFKRTENYKIVETDLTTGRFEFDNVPVGDFTLRAAGVFSPDPISFNGILPAAGQTVNVNLRLQATSVVTGTVFLPDGVTPAGQDISVKYKSDGFLVICSEGELFIQECQTIPQGIQETFTVTDEQGRFAFPLVNAGPFTLTIDDAATGRIATAKASARAGETADVSVRLLGRGSIAVQVVAHDGETEIPGARVLVTQLDYPNATSTAVADGDGRVTFTGGDSFGEGAFTVLATNLANGFAGRASGRITTDGETIPVLVTIADATGTIEGTVFRADGQTPVANAEVVISNGTGPLAFAISGPDGVFSEDVIPLGPFSIDAFDPATGTRGRATGNVDFAGQLVPGNVRLDPPTVVRGLVIDAATREPLKGWEVVLRQQTPSGRAVPELRTTTGVDGGFSFPGATVGVFSVTAQNRLIVGTGAASGDVAEAGAPVEVIVPVAIARRVTGRVEGVVLNAGGTPAAGAQVTMCPTGEGCRGTTAGDEGAYEFDDVPLGRLAVTARAQIGGDTTDGESIGNLLFEGDTAVVNVSLVGLGTVAGEVVTSDGFPALNATVRLVGQPGSGCAGPCVRGTDATGAFRFDNVPARSFSVDAVDEITGLAGAAGGLLVPGGTATVRIVLAPSGVVTGRAILPDGTPAQGVVAELDTSTGAKLFAGTTQDGSFTFNAVRIGPITLTVKDPIGPGLAKRNDTVTGDLDFGDIVLDTQPPNVGETTPASGAIAVPRDQILRVDFTEPLAAASVTNSNIALIGPSGAVPALLDLVDGDTAVIVRPSAALADQTRYTLRVTGVEDHVGKKMESVVVVSFTTIDVTAPSIVETTPTAGASGVTVSTTVRVKYGEPLDPARFTGAPIVVTGPSGAVEGRIDYLFSNTVAVFSPTFPLAENAAYQVQVQAAADPSGNRQPQGLNFGFTTTDRTPPVIASLTPTGGPTVIENTVKDIVATGVSGDVVVVDFYVDGALVLADRTSPFALSLQATPQLGAPGSVVHVTALATDTSGNRSATPASADITIVADALPQIAIASPVAGTTVRTGELVTVETQATDDVGLTTIGFKPGTSNAADASTRPVQPSATTRGDAFSFRVPAAFAPGPLTLEATAVDSKGQQTNAAAITLQVVDATAPVVTLTSNATGGRVAPGQQVTFVVSANDAGLVGSIGLETTGATPFAETRTVAPAQPSAVTAFSVTVPTTAASPAVLNVDAFALDQAGNRGATTRLTLAITDNVLPSVTLRTATGRLEMVPGAAVTVFADATDEAAVSRVDLTGTGAFSVSDAKAVSPPAATGTVAFVINVPATTAPGAVLALSARATDTAGNLSPPATLALTAVLPPSLTLPSSFTLLAGDDVAMNVSLSAPARAEGVVVTFSSTAEGVVSTPGPVSFAEGELVKLANVHGKAGGSATIRAFVDGAERASTNVTVIGGVVRGTVSDLEQAPAANVPISVFHASGVLTTTTDIAGSYLVSGITGTNFSVRAFDPDRALLGEASGSLDVAGGSAVANIALARAGVVHGTVVKADRTTLAGAGVQVQLFAASNPASPIATTITDANSAWQFSTVPVGSYLVEASDVDGNRARGAAAITNDDADENVTLAYLGRGSVIGLVRQSTGDPVPNATVELRATSIFGAAPLRSVAAGADGRYEISGVLEGTFTVSGRDPVSQFGGSTAGTLTGDGQTVTADVTIDAYAHVRGTIFRSDGATAVGPNVTVVFDACVGGPTASCRFTTATDAAGRYELSFMPFRAFTLTVSDPPTRGQAKVAAIFTVPSEIHGLDVSLAPQGTLLVTVRNTNGDLVPGATVGVTVTQGSLTDALGGITDANGVVVLQRLLAGDYVATASLGALQDRVTGVLGADETSPLTLVVGRKILTSITAAPSSVVLAGAGATQAVQVTGHYSDGSSEVLSVGVTFESANPAVASVTAAGVITATANGTATVTASVSGVPSATVSVLVRSLVGISVSPDSFTLIGVGSTRALSVTGIFSDGSSTPLGSGVTFTSSDDLVATVSAAGVVQANAVGSATITATFGAFQATSTVTVDVRRPVSLRVTPPSLAFTAVGATAQLAIAVIFNDGAEEPPTGATSFLTQNPIVATVTGGGMVTAVSGGSTFIEARAAGLVALVPVAVSVATSADAPVITAIGRLRAGEGDTFTISGRNFSGLPETNVVTVGGVAATVLGARHDRLIAVVPSGAVTGPVQVGVEGQFSNTIDLAIYPRRAEARLVGEPIATAPVAPGQIADFGTTSIDVRPGDVVVLAGHPNTTVAPTLSGLVGPQFTGLLTVIIDGAAQTIPASTAPVDLTSFFAPGPHTVELRLQEVSGLIGSRGLSIVSGPADTGALVGTRWMTANGVPESMTLRVRFPNLSDGQRVAATTVNWNRLSDNGCCNNSAGGAILDGAVTPNDGRFRTFTVSGGEITLTFSDTTVLAGVNQVLQSIISIVPADAAGNKTGDAPIAAITILEGGIDSSTVIPADTAQIADGIDRPVAVVVESIRDANGRLVPDGTALAITAVNWNRHTDNGCCNNAAGGTVSGGTATPNDGRFRSFTVVNGRANAVYSPVPLQLSVGDVRTAILSVVTAAANGTRTQDWPFGAGSLTLSSVTGTGAVGVAQPPSLGAIGVNNQTVITVAGLADAVGTPIPDGAKFAITAVNWNRASDGGCCNGSAAGSITGGDATPNDGRFRTFTLTNGQIVAGYSTNGFVLNPGQTATAYASVLPADANGNRVGDRPILAVPITLAGISQASMVPDRPSVVADSGVHPVRIVISGIRDALGNPVPDGTKIGLTAVNWGRVSDNGCCNNSAGGVLTDGVGATNDGRFKVYTVVDGRVEATYSPTGVQLSVGDVRSAIVSAVLANATNATVTSWPFASASITLSSASQATAVSTPSSILADGQPRQTQIIVTGLVDAIGAPLPDGTKVALTAVNWNRVSDGGCCNNSIGGAMLGGDPTPNDNRFRTFTVVNGSVTATYSTNGIAVDTLATGAAIVSVLPANADGHTVGSRPLTAATVTLTGMGSATMSGPPTLVPGTSTVVQFTDIRDALGNPVPDGTRIALTAVNWNRMSDNGCCNNSAGGSFVDGFASNDSRFRVYVVTGGQITATFQAPAADGVTSVISAVSADGANNRLTTRPFAIGTIHITTSPP